MYTALFGTTSFTVAVLYELYYSNFDWVDEHNEEIWPFFAVTGTMPALKTAQSTGTTLVVFLLRHVGLRFIRPDICVLIQAKVCVHQSHAVVKTLSRMGLKKGRVRAYASAARVSVTESCCRVIFVFFRVLLCSFMFFHVFLWSFNARIRSITCFPSSVCRFEWVIDDCRPQTHAATALPV
eukprot:COSAG05_NODE_2659_length_2793_cov_11.754640_2_plen_181_part_00